MRQIKILNNNRGVLTAEFIFAFVMAFGLMAILLSLTSTLAAVEVAQYIVFSTSRAYSAAHVDEAQQRAFAEKKFTSLIKNLEISPLLSGDDTGFFSIKNLEIRGGVAGAAPPTYNDLYGTSEPTRFPHTGVRVTFAANVLRKKLPFLGNTYSGDTDFETHLNAFLLREPTQAECNEQLKTPQHYEQILLLDPRYGLLGGLYKAEYNDNAATPVEDNGC